MRRTVDLATAELVGDCLNIVKPCEEAFTSRWRLSTLKRIDADLYARLMEQQALYDTALVTGSDAEAREQSAAMARGWRAACAALEQPLQPDDAYMLGVDPRTGTRVVISDTLAARGRVQALHGVEVVHMTPDEVASVVAGMRILTEAKRVFPDAELIRGGQELAA